MNPTDRKTAISALAKAQTDIDINEPESAVERLEATIEILEDTSE